MAKETCSVCGKGLNVFNKAARKDDEIMCFQCSDAAKKADKQAEKDRKAEEKAKAKEKPVCVVCGKQSRKIHMTKIKDDELVCADCFAAAFSFKEQVKVNPKEFTPDDIKLKIEERANAPEPESKLIKFGDKMGEFGESLSEKGKKMQKAGLHTTAAVWTPALYLGYRAVKKNGKKDNDKNAVIADSTPEQDLIKLIQECEQAHKDGKIDEEKMKEYIMDFTNNYYRNEQPPQS